MPTTPHCPRCDYDLQGQLATWHPQGPTADNAHCPTQGLCSECGLTFEWCLAMRPELADVSWFVECKRSHRERFSVIRTSFNARGPLHFWKKISLETSHDVSRRLWWLAWNLLIIPSLLCAVLFILSVALNTYNSPLVMQAWNGTAWVATPTPSPTLHEFFFVLPDAFSNQLMRLDVQLSHLRNQLDDTPAASLISMFLACALGFPAMLVVLPVTRARSKVHLGHVFRAATYAIAPLPIVIVTVGLLSIEIGRFPTWVPALLVNWHRALVTPSDGVAIALWAAPTLWFVSWWFCALRTGFRMKDWLPALLAMAIPASLLGLCFRFYFTLTF